jgi:hypothetical protein
MLTLPAETVDEITEALPLLGRFPRKQRVDFLNRARNKLFVRMRRGQVPQELWLKVNRLLIQERQRLAAEEARDPPYNVVDKSLRDLEIGEATRSSSDRYHGLLVARDGDGFYVTNGKGQTGRYSWFTRIPEEEILILVDENHPST